MRPSYMPSLTILGNLYVLTHLILQMSYYYPHFTVKLNYASILTSTSLIGQKKLTPIKGLVRFGQNHPDNCSVLKYDIQRNQTDMKKLIS